MLLANTVYFEGDWVQPFPSEYTRRGVFKPTGNDRDNLNVSYLMSQMEDIPYFEDDLLQMIELSYVGAGAGNNSKDISMFVLLPKRDKTLQEVVQAVSFGGFQEARKHKMKLHTVNVKMPKVSLLSHRINIKEVMERAWAQNSRRWKTELSNRTTEEPQNNIDFQLGRVSSDPAFVLSDFIQDTVLEVNEKGTRVASISGGIINYDGSKKVFRCDKPYLMMVHDNRNEVVLFWAAIYKPGMR